MPDASDAEPDFESDPDDDFAIDFEEMFRIIEQQAQTPLTVEEIATTLDDTELDDRVWIRLGSVIDYRDASMLALEHPDVRAYLATRWFEWEVGNGGLHQFFFNCGDDPELVGLILEGFSHLGCDDTRRVLEQDIIPIAEAEADWRESLRIGAIEMFSQSYEVSRLPEFDDRVEIHDTERVRMVRANPERFAR